MPETTTDRLRNVVLLSHSGAGKTVLSEAMVHASGVTNRMGSIEEGTTTSDFEPEEVRRQSSSQTSLLPCPWRGHKINLLDTPGYADFRGEVISGVRVADAAVVVVAAPAGVEVGTQQMWQIADGRGLPRMVFVSKMDRENADFQRAMDSLTEKFGRRCIAVNIPIGSEASFSGIVNLLDSDGSAPEGMEEEVKAARELLAEAAAETDDDLTTKFLEGEPLSQEEITRGIKKGVADGAIIPVLAGASTKDVGVREIMDAIVDYLPSPADAPPTVAKAPSSDEEVSLPADAGGPLAALVFKTAADPFVGKLSFFRVCSGTFKSDSQVWNANKAEAERVGQLFEVSGKNQEQVSALSAGDIGAVAKLSSVLTGDTLCDREQPLIMPGMEFPYPVYRMAVYPKSKADVDKMTSSLARIAEEDPSISVDRDPDTLEVLLGGLGDTHVEVAAERIKRKFGVDILLELPKVPYKETITAPTTVEYKHKKQSGGHGQYGHVTLQLEPLRRGAGFEFAHKVVGGAVPREYIPSVQKGIQKALPEGVVAGFPIVDLKATLVDGSFHSVDSSGIAFEIAGTQALIKGIEQAQPSLLEPVMRARIIVPDEYAGDVMGDLNSKRGRIQGMTPLGDGTSAVEVEVPQAEMLRYATELRSQTQGLGSFTIEFDHYEDVPQHMVARVVEGMKEREEARA
ncbi:MAG: elongation factor G [Chloroflexi bacterium]|nr:elongation factor G [Chloroflexota bacterium]